MIEVLKQALTDAKRNERHNNVAETRYWLNQYKLIAEQAIAKLESEKPVGKLQEPTVERAWFTIDELNAWADKKLSENPDWVMPKDEPERNEPPPQRTEQEPVAYLCENAVGHKYFRWKKPTSIYKPIALYTRPLQRTWVGLTGKEQAHIWANSNPTAFEVYSFAKAIEAKLKEKNT